MDAPTWDELYRLLPPELARYQLREAWSHEALWDLDLPIEELPRAELEWQLALPWWRHDSDFFVLRPLDVLARPSDYDEQWRRTLAADLARPLDVVLRRGRWFVLDGVHRLLKSVALGIETASVRKVPAEALPLIAVQTPRR